MSAGSSSSGSGHDRTVAHTSKDAPTLGRFEGVSLEGLIDPCVWYLPVHDEDGEIVDLRYVDANRAACNYNRMERESLIGCTLMDLFPSHGPTGMLRRYANVIDTGAPLLLDDVTYPLETAGGEERHYDIRAVQVGDGLSLTWRDVTERYSAQRAVAASEERFRLLSEHTTDVVYETDLQGRFVWLSPSVQHVLGWSTGELIGTRAWSLIATEDAPRVMHHPDHHDPQHPPEMLTEVRYRTVHGEHRWMAVHARPKHDADGFLAGVVVGLRDIHAEVVGRRALRALSATNAVVVRAESEDDLLRATCAAAVADGGYLHAQYTRAGDDRLPHEVSASAGTEAGERRVSRSTIAMPVSVDGVPDGVLRVGAGESDAFDANSVRLIEELAGQLGIGLSRLRAVHQLTDALSQHTLLLTAIEQAADSVVVTDRDARILYANPAACETTGYTLDELMGENPRKFQSGLHDSTFYDAMWSRLTGGQSFHGTMVNRRKSGEVYEEDATITPVHDDDGNLVAYVGVKHDLTRQRTYEQALRSEHSDRDVALEVMREVRPADTLEATADAFCQAITKLDRIDASIVMLMSRDGEFRPVGRAGYVGVQMPVGEVIPVQQVEGIIAHIRSGPFWLDLRDQAGLAGAFPEISLPMADAGFSVAAYAPIRWEGTVVGALAVTTKSTDAPAWIDGRLRVLEELGSFAGMLFGAQVEQYGTLESSRSLIRGVIDEHLFHPVFQPLVDLHSGRVVGYEALTRFDDGARPDLRISAAHAVGLGSEIEAACARSALAAAPQLPADAWLSLNFSPSSVVDGTAADVVRDSARQLVLEITEHIEVESYPAVRRAIRDCHGVKVAVDDAGAGFSSLRHILELQPDYVKLDIGLVRDIDRDPARQALAAGLRHFCSQTGTVMIAEGVERAGEAAMLRTLGVDLAQGYLYGSPARLP